MAAGILETYLVLMAIVSMNQPSGKNGITPEEEKEIVQRMKEREVTLREHQLCLEQEIAKLEARQKSVEWPLWDMETKIPRHTFTVMCLLVPVVVMIWSQARNEAPGEHREEEPNVGLLRKAWRGVAFLKKLFVLLIPIPVGFLEILY